MKGIWNNFGLEWLKGEEKRGGHIWLSSCTAEEKHIFKGDELMQEETNNAFWYLRSHP